MNDISRIFKSIRLDKYKQDTTCLYDPIRHLLVQKTPEEEVRQKTIKFLQDELGVPVDRVLVEESMSHVKKVLEVELILSCIEMINEKMRLWLLNVKLLI